MKTISARDFALLPLVPLVCLAKVGNEDKPMNAKCEMILLEAMVDFGLSKHGAYWANTKLQSMLEQEDIACLYHLKDRMEEVTLENNNYLARMLSFAEQICCLSMSEGDNLAKAVMMSSISKTLSISEEDLVDYPILKALVSETLKNDSRTEKVKQSMQAQIVDDNDDIVSPPSLTEILSTISIKGVEVHFADGVDVVTSDKFVATLATSFSLDKYEKKRVLLAVPTLSTFQIEQLMITFEEELSKFYDLAEKHPEDVFKLTVKLRIEWLELKKEFSKDEKVEEEAA